MSKMLLVPLLERDAIAKCIAIPAHAGYMNWLQARVAHAKSIAQYQGDFHSIQFYDRKALWLLEWPEGYGYVDNWRLDHTEKKEKRWNEDVIAALENHLWQPPTNSANMVVFRVWQPNEARVLVTEGGVNWVAYSAERHWSLLRNCWVEYTSHDRELSTEAIAAEYLNYIPGTADGIEEANR